MKAQILYWSIVLKKYLYFPYKNINIYYEWKDRSKKHCRLTKQGVDLFNDALSVHLGKISVYYEWSDRAKEHVDLAKEHALLPLEHGVAIASEES